MGGNCRCGCLDRPGRSAGRIRLLAVPIAVGGVPRSTPCGGDDAPAPVETGYSALHGLSKQLDLGHLCKRTTPSSMFLGSRPGEHVRHRRKWPRNPRRACDYFGQPDVQNGRESRRGSRKVQASWSRSTRRTANKGQEGDFRQSAIVVGEPGSGLRSKQAAGFAADQLDDRGQRQPASKATNRAVRRTAKERVAKATQVTIAGSPSKCSSPSELAELVAVVRREAGGSRGRGGDPAADQIGCQL